MFVSLRWEHAGCLKVRFAVCVDVHGHLLQQQQCRQWRGQIVTSISVCSVLFMIVALDAWVVFQGSETCPTHFLGHAVASVNIRSHAQCTSHRACINMLIMHACSWIAAQSTSASLVRSGVKRWAVDLLLPDQNLAAGPVPQILHCWHGVLLSFVCICYAPAGRATGLQCAFARLADGLRLMLPLPP